MPEMGTGKVVTVLVMTTTQRDALEAVEGMVIFNSTTDQLEEYDGTQWQAVGQVAVDTHAADADAHHALNKGARVYNSADQNVNNVTTTTLGFNSQRWDTDGIHDAATNNSRLTCKTAGKYIIAATVAFNYNATGDRRLVLLLNGTTVIARTQVVTASGYGAALVAVTIYDLDVDDYIEVQVHQNSGTTLKVAASNNFTPEFMMMRIA